ncbi:MULTISPECIES: acyltransferase [Salipiger]|nr:acyltransferase [Salipiger profundus]
MRLIMRIYAVIAGNERYGRKIGVKIGRNCRILSRRFGSEPFLIEIGDRVTISRDVAFFNHDGSTWLVRDSKGRRQRFGRIRIGSEVFVGAYTIILPGVDIGDRVVIGAGSVISRSVPSGVVVAGNPARIIGTFDDLHARRLSDCAAQNDLPSPRNVITFANAALMPTQPVMHVPEALRDRLVRPSNVSTERW